MTEQVDMQAQRKNSFLHRGIKNGFIVVKDSGAMKYDVKKLLLSVEGSKRLKRAIVSASTEK